MHLRSNVMIDHAKNGSSLLINDLSDGRVELQRFIKNLLNDSFELVKTNKVLIMLYNDGAPRLLVVDVKTCGSF